MVATPASNKTYTYSSDDIYTLKESVDLSLLVSSLGFNISIDNDREIRASCAVHGGDNKSAFRLNKETRTWQCFTNKCQLEHGYDIIGLIKGVLKVDFLGALDYIRSLVGDSLLSNKVKTERLFSRSRDSFVRSYSAPKMPEYVSETHLRAYRPLRSNTLFKQDRFSNKTLDYFEIAGGFKDDFGVLRDIIPIRDVDGNLRAYSLKDTRLNPPNTDYKYIITPGFLKDTVLYNLHNAKIYCNLLPLIIVEGFKSVWRLYDYGIYNTVCVMGSFLSPGQVQLLKVHALKGVIIMFDADIAGRDGTSLAIKALEKANIPAVDIDIRNKVKCEKDSPAELPFEDIYEYLYQYIR